MFDVTLYGALGNGLTDDTAAIQAALDDAHAHGGVLYVPAGTYRTTAGFLVNPYRVAPLGDGPQLTVFKPELAAGDYAFTFGWDPAFETGWKRGPFNALSGLTIELPTGPGQANAIRVDAQGAGGRAHSMTFRDVSLVGGEVQVSLEDYVYLTRFDRVLFNSPNAYGLRMDAATGSGENISLTSCVFAGSTAGSPATGVYINNTGTSMYFDHCSFDYLARAIWQRGGVTRFDSCHFETGTNDGGPGAEYLLLDRRGYIDRPSMTLTNCDVYTVPSTYDTLIRCKGDHGDQILRVLYPQVKLGAPADPACQYLVRDDGPSPSSIVIDAPGYGRGDTAPLKLRKQDGTDVLLIAGDRIKV